MVNEAIGALAERTGSSQQAIEKYIMANYPGVNYNRAFLRASLKAGTKNGSLTQVKMSWKISAAAKAAAKKAKAAAKKAASPKKKPAAKKKSP